MQRLSFALAIPVLALLLVGCANNVVAQSNEVVPTSPPEKATPTAIPEVVSKDPPASCPVSIPSKPEFVPPAIPFVSPSAPFPNQFWIGSKHLWTSLPVNGVWSGLPDNPEGYTQKIFWWSDLYSLKNEPEPGLVVTGQRLDVEALPLNVSKATNAYGGDIGESMLVGVDFPTLGCWEIIGKYRDAELSFVVWVAP